jgi:hypothetical protein
MYYAELLTGKGLFTHFGGWLKECRQDEKAALDEFLFRATSAILALEEMHFHERCCLQNFAQHKPALTLKRTRLVLWSPQLFQLFHHFSAFLSSMRFLQNMLLRLVGRRLQLRTSIPKSLRDAVPKIHSYGLPATVCDLVEDYWKQNGERLKDYRDLDQHHFTLCKHVFLQWSPTERVIVLLPDNPSVTGNSKLTFNQEIDALRYFVDAFNVFHQCAERIAISLGFRAAALSEELDTSGLGTLDEGIRQTLGLWVENSRTGTAIEFGQTEDRRLYFQRRIPASDSEPSG